MTDADKSIYALRPTEVRAAGRNADAVLDFRLILYCSQRLRNLLDQRLRLSGLTVQQGVMLSVVRARGRPTLGEVATAMATSHQNAKQIAIALERKGMLRIVADKEDRRARRLEPTAAGSRGWQDRDAGDFSAIGEWFSGLSKADQRQLGTLLERLAVSLGALPVSPPPPGGEAG